MFFKNAWNQHDECERLHFKELDLLVLSPSTTSLSVFSPRIINQYFWGAFDMMCWCSAFLRDWFLAALICFESMSDALNLLSCISLRELRLYKEPLLCNVCVCVCDKTERLNTALKMMMMVSTLSCGITSKCKCTQHGNYFYFVFIR